KTQPHPRLRIFVLDFCGPSVVPEGPLAIAQGFNLGCQTRRNPSPEGTVERRAERATTNYKSSRINSQSRTPVRGGLPVAPLDPACQRANIGAHGKLHGS